MMLVWLIVLSRAQGVGEDEGDGIQGKCKAEDSLQNGSLGAEQEQSHQQTDWGALAGLTLAAGIMTRRREYGCEEGKHEEQ